jgi:hypothetical protein
MTRMELINILGAAETMKSDSASWNYVLKYDSIAKKWGLIPTHHVDQKFDGRSKKKEILEKTGVRMSRVDVERTWHEDDELPVWDHEESIRRRKKKQKKRKY